MAIRCGHCKGSHDTVERVRVCAMQEEDMRAEYEAERAAERFYEEGTEAQRAQYAWEVEQDERNAAFWAGSF
jgi:hypothetical protein